MKLDEKRGLAILQQAEENGEDLTIFTMFSKPKKGKKAKPMYAGAIIGLGCRCGQPTLVIYSAQLCIEWLVKYEKMDYEGATEWFDFNTAGAWIGDCTPMILEDRV